MAKRDFAGVGLTLAFLTLAAALGQPMQAFGQGAAGAGDEVLIVVGPSSHPPGTHEVAAGARVMEYLIEHAQGVAPMKTSVVSSWPEDKAVLLRAACVVFIGDLFPGDTLPDSQAVKADIEALAKRGCGLVCVHFATGLRPQYVPENGDHPLLRWLGGYFASKCAHHQSVARVVTATLAPEPGEHPILRGWEAFTIEDEPYWNNYFGPNGPAPNVTPIVYAMVPPEAPKKEVVGWSVDREDGGRGVGLVFPHFFRNWKVEGVRTIVLNSIYYAAQKEIPAQGVKSDIPDLSRFHPESVEPQARASTPKKKAG